MTGESRLAKLKKKNHLEFSFSRTSINKHPKNLVIGACKSYHLYMEFISHVTTLKTSKNVCNNDLIHCLDLFQVYGKLIYTCRMSDHIYQLCELVRREKNWKINARMKSFKLFDPRNKNGSRIWVGTWKYLGK